jgi:hypothetical protein
LPVGIDDVDAALAEQVAAEFRSEGLSALALPGDVSRKPDVTAMFDRAEAPPHLSCWHDANTHLLPSPAPCAG